jgi:hypothetical protein
MNKSILPNARLLCLSSESLGRDWAEKSHEVDLILGELSMDLSEESVYILFDRAPGAVLAGEGSCQIARSIIGPKKSLQQPFRLVDWVQADVYRKVLNSKDWESVLEDCYLEWENLQRSGAKLASPFMILVKRGLKPKLNLALEVLFYE